MRPEIGTPDAPQRTSSPVLRDHSTWKPNSLLR